MTSAGESVFSAGGSHRTRSAFTGTGMRVAVLAGLVLLGIWLRVRGLTFGLPAVHHPDEVAIMTRALAFGTGDLNPHNFVYPSFFFYALFGWVGLYFTAAWLAGDVASLAAFQTQYFVDPSQIYLAGRTLGVAAGAGAIVLTYLVGRRSAGIASGLGGALLLAVAPTAVRDAHYVKHDVPVTLLILLAVLAILIARDSTRLRPERRGAPAGCRPDRSPLARYAIAGAATGVAVSTHYYSIFLLAPLVTAIALAEEPLPTRVRALLAAGAASAIAFAALSPFLVLEPLTAWRDIVANRQIVVDRAMEAAGPFPSAGRYLALLWSEGAGWPALGLAVLGALRLLRTDWRLAAVLLAFPLAFLVFIANTVAAGRYLNPLIPFVALLAAIGAVGLAQRTTARWIPAAVLILGLAALPALLDSLYLGWFFRQTDTRSLAQAFIERHVPPGATILVQPYSVQLQQSREGLEEALTRTLGDPARASVKFARRLALDPYPAPAYRTIYLGDGGLDVDRLYVSQTAVSGPHPLDALRQLGIEYVVLKRFPSDEGASRALSEALPREGRLLARFSPYREPDVPGGAPRVEPFLHNTDVPIAPALARPGPGIEVWQLPATSVPAAEPAIEPTP